MNRAINKKLIAIIAIVALVAILGVCLVACNADSVAKKLNNKGYTVIKINENSTDFTVKTLYSALKNNSDFEEGIVAAKDKDTMVIVVWFKSSDAAESFKGNALLKSLEKVERVGKIVYAGTEQGVKDAK